MATFVNNLRLKEITTGDESGTWGASTNTNLELIADGFGSGTIQLAADANETFTMADGVANDVRAFYLVVTSAGSLTATRTVTLAPNTVNKVWLIKNSTTGGQSIAISQGSGATVTIANGETKFVYADGAGGGAAVADLLSGITVSGAAKVEGATTLSTFSATASGTAIGTLTSTDAGAAIGPTLTLHRDSASPADNDVIGGINFDGEDAGGNQTTYARINAEISDVTDGTEDGDLVLYTMRAGTLTEVGRLSSDGKLFLGDVLGSSPGGEAILYRSGGNRPLIRLLDTTNDSFIQGGQTLRFGTFQSLGTTTDMELDADKGLRIDGADNSYGLAGFLAGTADGMVRSKSTTGVAAGATASLDIGQRFVGMVVCSNVDASNASTRSLAQYFVSVFEGNATVLTQISSANGSNPAALSVSYDDTSPGKFVVQNDAGITTTINIAAFGMQAL